MDPILKEWLKMQGNFVFSRGGIPCRRVSVVSSARRERREHVNGVVEPVVGLREVALAQVGRARPRRQRKPHLVAHELHEGRCLLLERGALDRETLFGFVV